MKNIKKMTLPNSVKKYIKEDIVSRYNRGDSQQEIARVYNVSRQYIHKVVQESLQSIDKV